MTAGSFSQISQKQMDDLKLKPEDFEGRPDAQAKLDSRAPKGFVQNSILRLQYRSGVFGLHEKKDTVVSNDGTKMQIQRLDVESLSSELLDKVPTERVDECAMGGGGADKAQCSQASEKPPESQPPNPKELARQKDTCEIQGGKVLSSWKVYGYYKLKDTLLPVRAAVLRETVQGKIKCEVSTVDGDGLMNTVVVVSPEIPNLLSPSSDSPVTVFAFASITPVAAKAPTYRSKFEILP